MPGVQLSSQKLSLSKKVSEVKIGDFGVIVKFEVNFEGW